MFKIIRRFFFLLVNIVLKFVVMFVNLEFWENKLFFLWEREEEKKDIVNNVKGM